MTILFALLLALSQSNSASIHLEAALVYQNGDVKPVARTEFLLLDDDLGKILNDAKCPMPYPLNLITQDAQLQQVITYGKALLRPEGYTAYLPEAAKALQPHVLQVQKTGFDGKASFTTEAKTVYLFAVTRTARGYVIWNHKLSVKSGENKVQLSQDEAAFVY